MIDPHILLILVGVLVHDAMGIDAPLAESSSAPWMYGLVFPLVLIVLQHAGMAHATRRLARTSRARWIDAVRWTQRTGATLGLVSYLMGVFVYGWLVWVRGIVGDLVVLDEALAVAPALCVVICGWFSSARMEQVLRDAMVIRRVDAGQEIHPPLSRVGILIDRIRHRAMFVLLPIGFLSAWSESVSLLHARAIERGWLGQGERRADALAATLDLLAIVMLIVVMPLLLRVFWRTSVLGESELRARLVSMCARHRVRIRNILVWWTHGTMLNGAVVGVVRWTRMILLTDELLATLRGDEIEAVMAHEVAHIKRHHIQWMLVLLVGGLVGLGVLMDVAGRLVGMLPIETTDDVLLVAQGCAGGLGMLVLVHVFGVVSRRFERQADAFAVQHASGLGGDNPSGFGLVATPEAIESMAGSLERIAAINAIPMRKRMFRHGSIASRVRAIRELAGIPLDHFEIDRVVRRTKRALLVAFLVSAALLTIAYVWVPTEAHEKAPIEGWVLGFG
ncbi:MAG: M48 family metalloprotease [Planctomycetota bacterium]|jgi:Zn-dependent protease with chaperone function